MIPEFMTIEQKNKLAESICEFVGLGKDAVTRLSEKSSYITLFTDCGVSIRVRVSTHWENDNRRFNHDLYLNYENVDGLEKFKSDVSKFTFNNYRMGELLM